MIQEFALGFFLGFYYAKSKVKKNVNASVQVDETPFVSVSSPILIPNSKIKTGPLTNFWGSDS